MTGGTALTGRVRVTGAKNSALKLMAAALLAPGRTTIDEVPDILDVAIMSEVLRRLGCDVDVRAHRRRRWRRPGRRRRAREALDRDRLRPGPQDARLDQRARPAGRPLRLRAGGAARRRRDRLPRPGHAHLRPRAARRDDRQRARLPRRDRAPADRHVDLAGLPVGRRDREPGDGGRPGRGARRSIDNAAREPEIVDLCTMLGRDGRPHRRRGHLHDHRRGRRRASRR